MIEFNKMKVSYLLSVVVVFFLLSACGMQGDLYLPEEENKVNSGK